MCSSVVLDRESWTQLMPCHKVSLAGFLANSILSLNILLYADDAALIPVSYTHLDVYKRQISTKDV